MCSICQIMREAMEGAGKVSKEEVDKLFLDAERSMKKVEKDLKSNQ